MGRCPQAYWAQHLRSAIQHMPSNAGAGVPRKVAHNLTAVLLLRGQALKGEGFTCAVQLPTRLVQAQAGAGQLPCADGHRPICAATCTDPALAGEMMQLEPAIQKATNAGCTP